jgi:hypothetical protein
LSAIALSSLAFGTALALCITAVIGTFRANSKLARIEVNVDGRLTQALERIDELRAVIVSSNKEVPPGPHDPGTQNGGETR